MRLSRVPTKWVCEEVVEPRGETKARAEHQGPARRVGEEVVVPERGTHEVGP